MNPPPAECVARRLALCLDREAIRLSHREHHPGVTVDDYGGHLLVTDYADLPLDDLRAAAEGFLDALTAAGRPAHGATLKRRPDNLSHRATADGTPTHLVGEPAPDWFEVDEAGARYRCSFGAGGFATGLFLDMAPGRAAFAAHAGGARVLNLFSYTGAFSIVSALAGAPSVIEVDASGKWLGWAQENQRLNGLGDRGLIRQRRGDAVGFVGRAEDGAFDLVACDPPSYARPKRGKRFTVEQGYREMGPHFERILGPGGRLLACCNHAATDRRRFARWLPAALELERWIEPGPDFPGADYLKVGLFRRR